MSDIDFAKHEFHQIGGDSRTITITQVKKKMTDGDMWVATFMDSKTKNPPRDIVMNNMLLPVLAWLRTTSR